MQDYLVFDLFDVFLENTIAVGMPQFAKGLRFNLANPLTGYIKNLANLFEGFHSPVIKAVAQPQHISLAGAQRCQNSF